MAEVAKKTKSTKVDEVKTETKAKVNKVDKVDKVDINKIEEKIRLEYEKKLELELFKLKKEESKTKQIKKTNKVNKIPLDINVPVKSNYQGRLNFESKKTMGYLIEWDSYGSTEYMELSELVGMRNSSRRFFEDNWITVEDTDEYSAGEIYQFLKVDKYYKNILTPDGIEKLFKKNPNEIIKAISSLSSGMKDVVKTKAKIMYDDKTLDSNKVIDALETALDVKFSI